MLFATSELAPPATLNPSGVWFFNWVIPIAGSIFIVLAVTDAIRRRRLTWGFLLLFNSLAVYWMRPSATGARCCTFFVFLIIPLVVLRTLTGAESPHVP
jgi:hypothetical protein